MQKQFKQYFLILIFIFLFVQSSFALTKIDITNIKLEPIEPTDQMRAVCMDIVGTLQKKHYHQININDNLSMKLFDAYFENLDPAKNIFLASNIQDFEKFRTFLDDALNLGYLNFAFDIFNVHRKLYVQRLVFAIDMVENKWDKIDFSKTDSIETDYEKLSFAKTEAEINERWLKKIKNDIILLQLAGKDDKTIKQTLSNRYRTILNHFIQTKSMDVFQLYANSFTKFYDAHTDYFSPKISEEFDIRMKLSFEGIGATLGFEEEYTKVVNLIKGGPADKAGDLKEGDLIIGVGQGPDGKIVDVVGWRLDNVVDIIRGEKGTLVQLEVIPSKSIDKKSKIVKIVRDKVELKEQEAKKNVKLIKANGKTYKIGIIDIPTFYLDMNNVFGMQSEYKSVSHDVKRLLDELNNEKVDGIVIDLRNNGGGALVEANKLAGFFIRTGPIVQVDEKASRKYSSYEDNDPQILFTKPMIVLTNRYSASASEIFAGAMQDYKRALIVGSNTFGKGSVQTLVPLSVGQIKYTISKYYRISGESTQLKGVAPDILMPSIFDEKKVGEASEKNPLSWDKIEKMSYDLYPFVNESIIKSLTNNHKKRISKDPDFIALIESIDLFNEVNDKTLLSLNKKDREKEFESIKAKKLAITNKQRKAKGLPLLKDIQGDLIEDNIKSKKEDKEEDAFLQETSFILCDYIDLLKPKTEK